MSKATEARVRDELLQQLYAGCLHCALAAAQTAAPAVTPAATRTSISDAAAAGICANLREHDLLLLPAQGASAFRTLRGLSSAHATRTAVALTRGIVALPRDESQAVALAVGAAAATRHANVRNASDAALVCVVLPPSAAFSIAEALPAARKPRSSTTAHFPLTWTEAAHYAASLSLPLLLVTDRHTKPRSSNLATGNSSTGASGAHLQPAPLYPSIPVDREDALAIYRVAFECSTRARLGIGPSHIACVPFHVHGQPPIPDDKPLTRLESMLRRRGAFSKPWRRSLEHSLIRQLTENA